MTPMCCDSDVLHPDVLCDVLRFSWMMKREAVEGLSPGQIQSKYALPEVPTYMSELHVPAGTRIRTGIVNFNE